MLEVDPALQMRRPTVVDLSGVSGQHLVPAELARRAGTVRGMVDEPQREQVHAAAGWTAG